MKVFLINKDGRPMMPTTPRKARTLLESGKAKIAGRDPFTIQLIYGSAGYTQLVTLGVDAGYSAIGFSAITEKEELIGGELNLLPSISERLTERRKYRVQRRNRLRHRAPRFDNRRRPTGWLAPSTQHKFNAHIKLVERIKARLPVARIMIETASFDIQKINNPEIEDVEYQAGEQLGYHNLTAYIRHRDNYKCQNPNCKSKPDTPTQIHHLGYWKSKPDRSDRPANLITLCVKCHTPANHQQGKLLFGWKPKVKSFKAETFMTIVYRRLLAFLVAEEAFGFETKFKREELHLDKSHHNDAFVIAGGTTQIRCETLVLEQVRCNKRSLEQFYDAKYVHTQTGEKVSGSQLFSGRRTRNLNLNGENLRVYRGEKVFQGQRRIKKQCYRFSPNDYISFEGVVYRVVGMQNLGIGVKIADYPGVKNKVVNINEVISVKRRSGICTR
jgi:hypothetical protein